MWHEKQLFDVKEVLQKTESILVVGHIDPDGDDISSMLSMTFGLRRLGKKVVAAVDSPIPDVFQQLVLCQQILDWDTFYHSHSIDDFDCMVVVDASSSDRIGRFEQFLGLHQSVVIDHHATNTFFGTTHWVETKAAATAQMVFKLFEAMGVGLDPVLASLLLLGIQTDSGFFKYSNTNALLLEDASRLAKVGADASFNANMVLENQELSYYTLLKIVLEHMQVDFDQSVAYSFIRYEDLKRLGSAGQESSGFVGQLRSLKGIEAALFFTEEEVGQVKVSMRSKAWFDISAVAVLFDGGGHPKAAGCTVKMGLEEAILFVMDEIKDQMRLQTQNLSRYEEEHIWEH